MADDTEKPHKLLPLNPLLSDPRQTQKADVCGNWSACGMSSLSHGEIYTWHSCVFCQPLEKYHSKYQTRFINSPPYSATLPSTRRDALCWNCRASSMDGGKLVLVFLLSVALLLDFSLLFYVVHSAPLAVMYQPRYSGRVCSASVLLHTCASTWIHIQAPAQSFTPDKNLIPKRSKCIHVNICLKGLAVEMIEAPVFGCSWCLLHDLGWWWCCTEPWAQGLKSKMTPSGTRTPPASLGPDSRCRQSLQVHTAVYCHSALPLLGIKLERAPADAQIAW